jgi:23S rRNA (uracil1939-C5)-methyltransferase
VGRVNGAVLFIPNAAPSEKLKVKISQVHKNYFEGEIIEILSPSSARRTPHCPVFNKCGGCSWQHIEYKTQLKEKESFFRHFLRKVTHPETPFEMWAAPSEFNYRNRIQLHVRNSEIGYFARGTNDLVAIEACPIASDRINQKLKSVIKSLPQAGKYELAEEADGSVSLRPVPKRGLEFRQINTAQNQKLKELVISLTEKINPKKVIELYCGSGNFSFALARAFPQISISAVEENKESVHQGVRQAHLENLTQLSFIQSDAGRYLKKNAPSAEALLLVDPPRVGLHRNLIEDILSAQPSNIIYISCNLATLERDLVLLSSSYDIQCAHGVDMFPQTDYLESIIHLALRPTQ